MLGISSLESRNADARSDSRRWLSGWLIQIGFPFSPEIHDNTKDRDFYQRGTFMSDQLPARLAEIHLQTHYFIAGCFVSSISFYAGFHTRLLQAKSFGIRESFGMQRKPELVELKRNSSSRLFTKSFLSIFVDDNDLRKCAPLTYAHPSRQ